MNLEKERKFLVKPEKLPPLSNGRIIRSAYFTQAGVAIRVTISSAGRQKICVKGPGTLVRQEFEYSIPLEDAERLMLLAPTYITKTRYEYDGWDIDHVFTKDFDLWIAEFEESDQNGYQFPKHLPEWLDEEVTEKPQEYSMMALAWKYGCKPDSYMISYHYTDVLNPMIKPLEIITNPDFKLKL